MARSLVLHGLANLGRPDAYVLTLVRPPRGAYGASSEGALGQQLIAAEVAHPIAAGAAVHVDREIGHPDLLAPARVGERHVLPPMLEFATIGQDLDDDEPDRRRLWTASDCVRSAGQ